MNTAWAAVALLLAVVCGLTFEPPDAASLAPPPTGGAPVDITLFLLVILWAVL